MTGEEISYQYCFVSDPVDLFKPYRVIRKHDGGEISVADITNLNIVKNVQAKDVFPITDFSDIQEPPCDLIKLIEVNRPGILHALRHRFKSDLIYTSVGPILVALNPFKWIPGIYDEDLIRLYQRGELNLSKNPHVFAITHETFMGLQSGINQSLIISGESGAGKTETTKQCLNFLARVAGSKSGVQEKILRASPILEALGNAKTIRNNNSSRFGKFIEIWIEGVESGTSNIVGSSNTTYLLEKSRVVFQETNERNYHIFYQLIKGASSDLKSLLGINELSSHPENIAYINQSGCIDIDEVDDAADFENVQAALVFLGFTDDEITNLWKIMAGILHFGNIRFTEKPDNLDATIISLESMMHLEQGCSLFGIDKDLISLPLLQKKIQVRGRRSNSLTYSSYRLDVAIENRNAMVKEIYNRVFNWVVTIINAKINPNAAIGRSAAVKMVGILDIFGFEIFKTNSLEQLCINLANESLQQHFNYNIFWVEMELYRSEDIPVPALAYNDNRDVLDLIMKRPQGIIATLDEEGLVPRGSSEGFLNKINKINAAHKRYKPKPLTREFVIVHYAGEVIYDPALFLIKNKDTLSQEILENLAISIVPILSESFKLTTEKEGERSDTSSNKYTVGRNFSIQLDSLIKNLNNTQPHYIRCIKPNHTKKPGVIVADVTNEQLTYSGVFEAVIIMQSGYPFRLSLYEFREKYHLLALDHEARNRIFHGGILLSKEDSADNLLSIRYKNISTEHSEILRTCCRDLITFASNNPATPHEELKNCFVGRTMVFYRSPQHYYLRAIVKKVKFEASVRLQRYYRMCTAKKLVSLLLNLKSQCESAIWNRHSDELGSKPIEIKNAADRLYRSTIISRSSIELDCCDVAKALLCVIKYEEEHANALKSLITDVSKIYGNFHEIDQTMERVKSNMELHIKYKGRSIDISWSNIQFFKTTAESIIRWKSIVNMKRQFQNYIELANEVELESLLYQVDQLRGENLLDPIISIDDEIETARAIIRSAEDMFTAFHSLTIPIFDANRMKLSQLNEFSISYEVGLKSFEIVEQILEADIGHLTKSKRVEQSMDLFRRISIMRDLASQARWFDILSCVSDWSDIIGDIKLELSDEGLLESLHQSLLPLVSAQNISSRENLLMTKLWDSCRQELFDIIKASVYFAVFPNILDSIKEVFIPNEIFVCNDGESIIQYVTSQLSFDFLDQSVQRAAPFADMFDSTMQKLFQLAMDHRNLRSAFLSEDCEQLHNALQNVISPNIRNQQDFVNAMNYFEFYRATACLTNSMANECGVGNPGDVSFNSLSIDLLSESVDISRRLTVQDPLWSDMVVMSDFLVIVRKSILNSDPNFVTINKLDLALDKLRETSTTTTENNVVARLRASCIAELLLYNKDIRHREAVEKLSQACNFGSVKGSIGNINFHEVNFERLSDAVASVRCDIIAESREGPLLVDSIAILAMRKLIFEEAHTETLDHFHWKCWDSVYDILHNMYGSLSEIKSRGYHITSPEIESIFLECHDVRTMRQLLTLSYKSELALSPENDVIIAVDEDRPSTDETNCTDHLSLYLTELSQLQSAITLAEASSSRSPQCDILLKLMQILYDARNAIMDQNWESSRNESHDSSNVYLLALEKVDLLDLPAAIGNLAGTNSRDYMTTMASVWIEKLIQPDASPWEGNTATAVGASVSHCLLYFQNLLAPSKNSDYQGNHNLPISASDYLKQQFVIMSTMLVERRCRVLILVCSYAGRIEGNNMEEIAQLKESINYRDLTQAIWFAKSKVIFSVNYSSNNTHPVSAFDLSKSSSMNYTLSITLNNWLIIGECILHLRTAVLSSLKSHTVTDSNCYEIENFIDIEDISVILDTVAKFQPYDTDGTVEPQFPIQELIIMKRIMSVREISGDLSQALKIGGAEIRNGKFEIEFLKYSHIDTEIVRVKSLLDKSNVINSVELVNLTILGEICINLRKSLISQQWGCDSNGEIAEFIAGECSVSQLIQRYRDVSLLLTSGQEYRPPKYLDDEFALVERELHRQILVRSFSRCLETFSVKNSHSNYTSLDICYKNIRTDLIESKLDAVDNWCRSSHMVDNSSIILIDPELSHLVKAASEIKAIRKEMMLLDSIYYRDNNFAIPTNSIRQIIGSQYITDALNSALSSVQKIAENPSYLENEWKSIAMLIAQITAAHTIKSTAQEIDLLTKETFSRQFISKIIGIFRNLRHWRLLGIFFDLSSPISKSALVSYDIDQGNVRAAIQLLFEQCQSYLARFSSSKENYRYAPSSHPIVSMVFNSAVVLLHLLRCCLLGLHDTEIDRQWLLAPGVEMTSLVNSLHHLDQDNLLCGGTVSSPPITVQLLIRTVQQQNLQLHNSLQIELARLSSDVQDLISLDEMWSVLDFSHKNLCHVANNNLAWQNLENEDIEFVMNRIEIVGINHNGIKNLYSSFQQLSLLRSILYDGNFEEGCLALCAQLNFSQDFKSLLSGLLGITDSVLLRVHSYVAEEFRMLVSILVNSHMYSIAVTSISKGSVSGIRGKLNSTLISTGSIDKILEYAAIFSEVATSSQSIFRWSDQNLALYRLLTVVKKVRDQISEEFSNLKGASFSRYNQLIQNGVGIRSDVLLFDAILINCDLLDDIIKYFQPNVLMPESVEILENLSSEIVLIREHCNYLLALFRLESALDIQGIWSTNGGLQASRVALDTWRDSIHRVKSLNLSTEIAHEKWWLNLLEYVQLCEDIIERIIDESSASNILLELPGDQNSLNETKDSLVTLESKIYYSIQPGSATFDNILPLFNRLETSFGRNSSSEYSEEKNGILFAVPVSLVASHNSILQAIKEHQFIVDLHTIVWLYQPILKTNPSTDLIELTIDLSVKSDIDFRSDLFRKLMNSFFQAVQIRPQDYQIELQRFIHGVYSSALTFPLSSYSCRLNRRNLCMLLDARNMIFSKDWSKLLPLIKFLELMDAAQLNTVPLPDIFTDKRIGEDSSRDTLDSPTENEATLPAMQSIRLNCISRDTSVISDFLEVLVLQRKLEYGLLNITIPGAVGWSHGSHCDKFVLSLGDLYLSQIIQGLKPVSSFGPSPVDIQNINFSNKFIRASATLVDLIMLSLLVLELVNSTRSNNWFFGTTVALISCDETDLETGKLSKIESLSTAFTAKLKSLGGCNQVTTEFAKFSSDFMNRSVDIVAEETLRFLSKKNSLHDNLKKYVVMQIERVQLELQYQKLSRQCLSLLSHVAITGIPGAISVSETAKINIRTVCQLLESPDYIDVTSCCYELTRVYQTSKLFMQLISALDRYDNAEVRQILAICRKMISIPELFMDDLATFSQTEFQQKQNGTNVLNDEEYIALTSEDLALLIQKKHLSYVESLSNPYSQAARRPQCLPTSPSNLTEHKAVQTLYVEDFIVLSVEKMFGYGWDGMLSFYNFFSGDISGRTVTGIANFYSRFLSLLERHCVLLGLYEDIFQKALVEMPASGKPGELRRDVISYSLLEQTRAILLHRNLIHNETVVIDLAFVNQPAYLLDAAAMCLLRLRRAQMVNNMEAVRTVLKDIEILVDFELHYLETLLAASEELYSSVVSDSVHVNKVKASLFMCISAAEDEVMLAKNDLVQHDMAMRLSDAICSGQVSVAVELESFIGLRFPFLNLVELAAAMTYCSDRFDFSQQNIGTQCCAEVVKLFKTAEIIFEIRQLFNGSRWTDLKLLIEALHVEAYHSIAQIEIISTLRVTSINLCIEGANCAYKIGSFRIFSSALNFDMDSMDWISEVKSSHVSDALLQLQTLHDSFKTAAVLMHINTCQCLAQIRAALVHGQWKDVYDICMVVLDPDRLGVKDIDVAVVDEIEQARRYCVFQLISSALRTSFEFGKLLGSVGGINISGTMTAGVRRSQEFANEMIKSIRSSVFVPEESLQSLPLQVQGLMNSAEIIARLRSAATSNRWISPDINVSLDDISENSDKEASNNQSLLHARKSNRKMIVKKYASATVEDAMMQLQTATSNELSLEEVTILKDIRGSSLQASTSDVNLDEVKWMNSIQHIPMKYQLLFEEEKNSSESVEKVLFDLQIGFSNSNTTTPSDSQFRISSRKFDTKDQLRFDHQMSPEIFDEVKLFYEELMHRKIIFSLLVAIKTYGPHSSCSGIGVPGMVDLTALNVVALKSAIALAEEYPVVCSQSSTCENLLEDAKTLLSARLWRLQSEWQMLRALVDEVKEFNSLGVDICTPCENLDELNFVPRKSVDQTLKLSGSVVKFRPLFKPVWDELLIYEADMGFQICLANFAEEVNIPIEELPESNTLFHNLEGTHGDDHLTSAQLNARRLKSIRRLAEIITETKKYSLLCPSAISDTINADRKSSTLGSRREFYRLLQAMHIAMELRLRRVHEPEKLSRDILDSTAAIKSSDTANQLPSYVALLSNDLSYLSKVADKERHVKSIQNEIVLGQAYLKSSVGLIIHADIDIAPLRLAIDSAETVLKVLGTKDDTKLLTLAAAICTLRKSVANTSWDEVREIIYDNAVIFDSAIVSEEIGRLLIEAENHDVYKMFEETLKKGQILDVLKIARMINRPRKYRLSASATPGRGGGGPGFSTYSQLLDEEVEDSIVFSDGVFRTDGNNNKTFISSMGTMQMMLPSNFDEMIQGLEKVMDIASRLETRSGETTMYLKSSKLILTLRKKMAIGNWEDVSKIVFHDVNDSTLPQVVLEEIKAVRSGLLYRSSITKLADAMVIGSVTVTPDEINVAVSSMQGMKTAFPNRSAIESLQSFDAGEESSSIMKPGYKVNLSSVDFIPLQEAILRSERLDKVDPAMEIILFVARSICDIRRAIKEGRWLESSCDLSETSLDLKSRVLSRRGTSESFSVVASSLVSSEGYRRNSVSDRRRSSINLISRGITSNEGHGAGKSVETLLKVYLANKAQKLDSLKSILNINDDSQDFKISYSLGSASSSGVVDWIMHQWNTVRKVDAEIELIHYEYKDRLLRQRLINAIEILPLPIKMRFDSTQSYSHGQKALRRENGRRKLNGATSKFSIAGENDVNSINSRVVRNSATGLRRNSSIILMYGNNDANEVIDLLEHENSQAFEDVHGVAVLQDTINYVSSQFTNSSDISQETHKLLATAKLLLLFRIAIKEGIDLEDYRKLVKETNSMQSKTSNNCLSDSYGVIELQTYQSASMSIHIARMELIKAIEIGKISGFLDNIVTSDIEIDNLTHWVASSRQLLLSSEKLSVDGTFKQIAEESEILLEIRKYVKDNQWTKLQLVWSKFSDTIVGVDAGTTRLNLPRLLMNASTRNSNDLKFIQNEFRHAFAAFRLRQLNQRVRDILSGQHPFDLEHKYSIFVVKSMELQGLLSDMEQEVFKYKSDLLPSKKNRPFDSTRSSVNPFSFNQFVDTLSEEQGDDVKILYESARRTVALWKAVCGKSWGAEAIASGNMHLFNSSVVRGEADYFLSRVFSRFQQHEVVESLKDVHRQLLSLASALQSTPGSSKRNIRASILIANNSDLKVSPAPEAFSDPSSLLQSTQLEVIHGESSKDIKSISNRRVSISVPQNLNQPSIPQAPANKDGKSSVGRRSSVAALAASKPTRRGSVSVAAENYMKQEHQRRGSAISTANAAADNSSSSMNMNRAISITGTVAEILSVSGWSHYPDNISLMFSNARNILIDKAVGLRMSYCCSSGPVKLDYMGNLVVENPDESIHMLKIAMNDERTLSQEALYCRISLQWSEETTRHIKITSTLLNCRQALINKRVDILVNELSNNGLLLGFKTLSMENMIFKSIGEFDLLENFARENMSEMALRLAIYYLRDNWFTLKTELSTEILKLNTIAPLHEMKRPHFQNKMKSESSNAFGGIVYRNALGLIAGQILLGLQGAIMGNQFRIMMCKKEIVGIINKPPFPLIDVAGDVLTVLDNLIDTACERSGGISMKNVNLASPVFADQPVSGVKAIIARRVSMFGPEFTLEKSIMSTEADSDAVNLTPFFSKAAYSPRNSVHESTSTDNVKPFDESSEVEDLALKSKGRRSSIVNIKPIATTTSLKSLFGDDFPAEKFL